jgi:hypothetical protein
MKWSKYQVPALDHMVHSDRNLVVNARAGTGKTTLIVESIRRIRYDKKDTKSWILVLAFNRKIVKELIRKLTKNGLIDKVLVTTSHGFGMRTINGNGYRGKCQISDNKYYNITKTLATARWNINPDEKPGYIKEIVDLTTFGRLYLCTTIEELDEVGRKHNVAADREQLERAMQVINSGSKNFSKIDFTDMLYLPLKHQLRCFTYRTVFIDECVTGDAIITTTNGDVKLEDIKVGDVVLAYDENLGRNVWDRVVNKWDKGIKKILEIKTKSGQSIRCTTNHKIYTNYGWMYAGDIKRYINVLHNIKLYFNDDQNKGTANIGFDAGRHEHGYQINKISQVEGTAFSQTVSICGSEIFDSRGLGEYATETDRESGVRRLPLQVSDSIKTRASRILYHLYGKWEEEGDYRMVAEVVTRGISLLVDGRWIDINKQVCEDLHTLFLKGRIGIDTGLLHEHGYAYLSEDQEEQISSIASKSGSKGFVSGYDKAVGHTFYGVQVAADLLHEEMRDMRNRIQNTQRSIHGVFESMSDNTEKSAIECLLSYEEGVRTQGMCNLWFRIPDYQPKQSDLLQGLLQGTQKAKAKGQGQGTACATEIESIEWCGEERVYDVETESTHTFYANGLLVHNCQDLSVAQRLNMLRAVSKHGKFIAVGDPKQAINGFAGADATGFQALCDMPDTDVLTLPLTYRCPKSVTEEARKIVPDFECPDDAIEGVNNWDGSYKDIKAGDMVLCRNTFPLVSLCMEYWADGRKAVVLGNDIGTSLVNMIENSLPLIVHNGRKRRLRIKDDNYAMAIKTKGLDDKMVALYDNLNSMLANHLQKLMKKWQLDKDKAIKTNSYQIMKEKVMVIERIGDTVSTVTQLIDKIKKLFVDDNDVDESSTIVLSTMHKSKGLENDRIFIIQPELIPSKYAKQEWEIEQEYNLLYVAITRAIEELHVCHDYNAYDKKMGR